MILHAIRPMALKGESLSIPFNVLQEIREWDEETKHLN